MNLLECFDQDMHTLDFGKPTHIKQVLAFGFKREHATQRFERFRAIRLEYLRIGRIENHAKLCRMIGK